MPYSYSPQKLLESYQALKKKEATTPSGKGEASSPPKPESRPNLLPGSFAVSAIQITASGVPDNDVEGFWTLAQNAVQDAAAAGANLILLPELFIGPYFCQSQEADLMGLADSIGDDDHFMLTRMRQLAQQYQVVLPISLYERKNNALYNSIVMIDADGSIVGTYRTFQKCFCSFVGIVTGCDMRCVFCALLPCNLTSSPTTTRQITNYFDCAHTAKKL